MSTPSRPLSPQRDSVINSRSSSPLKSKQSTPAKAPARAIRKLPKLGTTLSPSRPAAGFQIYEDTQEDYELHHKPCSSESLDSDDKENILQPKIVIGAQANIPRRMPLAPLSAAAFPGYLHALGSVNTRPMRLTELYQPNNTTSESGSTLTFNTLPSFVTPPRNTLNKILHRSDTADEQDELELRLMLKNRNSKRIRSLLVGGNKGKLHLVHKNKFEVFTA